MGRLKIQKNILLAPYTTFHIGGPAKYFFSAKNKDDLIEAIRFARGRKLPYFILGGGSNLLVSDQGFKGIVIIIRNLKLEIRNSIVRVGAGVKLSDLIKMCVESGLSGLEWAAGIPRVTIGGAIRGNAGAFGKSMADLVKSVEVLDKSLKTKIYFQKDCRFAYRESIFKHEQEIILSAELILAKKDKKDIQQEIKNVLAKRKNQPLEFFSAGSVFKNPTGQSAGALIEQAGLKGKKIGQAQTSTKHANFIVNLDKAKAKDVLALIKLAKKQVKEKFKINLKEEIEYLGF